MTSKPILIIYTHRDPNYDIQGLYEKGEESEYVSYRRSDSKNDGAELMKREDFENMIKCEGLEESWSEYVDPSLWT